MSDSDCGFCDQELTPAEWSATHDLLIKARAALHDVLAPDGYTLGWNASRLHAHLHVIPRFHDEPRWNAGVRSALNVPDNKRPDPWRRGDHTYAFYSIARDQVANVEGAKTAAEATTKVVASPPTTTASPSPLPNSAGWNNATVTVQLSATGSGGAKIQEISYSLRGARERCPAVTVW